LHCCCSQVTEKDNVTRIILDDTMWEHMHIVVHALFPALIVLCVADSNKPGMDKLFFMYNDWTSV